MATRNPPIENLTRAIGHVFRDQSLLILALTHRSALNEEPLKNGHGVNNERLEFLGDAVLSLVSADYLFSRKPHLNEGDLSRLRAQYVCKDNLANAGKRIGLSDFILSDKAMKRSGSTSSHAVLADAIEAIIGAVFLDGGLECAKTAVLHILGEPKTQAVVRDKDAKTKLQEIVQATTNSAPKYEVLGASGPAHAPQFLVAVQVQGKKVAEALGESKKAAAQNAAVIALDTLQRKDVHSEPA